MSISRSILGINTCNEELMLNLLELAYQAQLDIPVLWFLFVILACMFLSLKFYLQEKGRSTTSFQMERRWQKNMT